MQIPRLKFNYIHGRSAFTRAVRYALSVLAMTLCFCVVVSAEQRELSAQSKLDKLDAILLLDASGSMRTTDPGRLRDEGAKLFVRFLKPGDRLGIYEFSESVKPVRPLSEFDRAQVDQVGLQLATIGNAGTYTDLLSAIKTAHADLKANARPDAKQIIVLLSDGKMEPDPAVGTPAANSSELINLELPALKTDGIKVHTLYFSELADKDLLAEIALGSDGVNWFTPTADKIHESYADLFLVVMKPQIVPMAGKAFMIDEDINEATFYINREEGAVVSLETPDEALMTKDTATEDVKWYSGTKFEVVTVEKPKPGKWKISGMTNAEGFATVLTDLKLITEWPSSFNAEDKVLLQARLYEEKKPVTLPHMTGSVKYGFQIIPTDKVSEPIIRSFLVDDATDGDKIAEDGIYSKTVDIKEPGEYKLTIVAKGPTFTRHQQIPFRVKPRLITLRVTQASAEEGHTGAEHGDEHGAADSHDKGHDAGEHADAHEEPAHDVAASDAHLEEGQGEKEAAAHGDEGVQGSHSDVFEVVLSPDASSLKQQEVKLVAIDSNRRRFTLPVSKLPGKNDVVIYQAPSSVLPGSGAYELQASLNGVTGKKEHVHAETDVLKYLKAEGAAVQDQEHELVVQEKVVKEGFPFVGLALITIINVLCAAGIAFYLKKIITGGSFELPEMPQLEPVRLALAGLQEKLQLTALDLNDPRFAGASDEATADTSSVSAAKQSTSAPTPEPEEAPAGNEEAGDESEQTPE